MNYFGGHDIPYPWFFHSNTPLTEFNVPSRKISGHLQKLKSRWKRGHSCGSQAEVEWTFHPGGIHPITRWDPSDPLKFCQTVFTRWRGVLHQSRELTKSWNCQWAVKIFGVTWWKFPCITCQKFSFTVTWIWQIFSVEDGTINCRKTGQA